MSSFLGQGVGGVGCRKENLKMLIDLLESLWPLHLVSSCRRQGIKWPPLVAFRRGLQCWVLAVIDYSPTVGPQCGVQGESHLKLSSDYLALNKGPAFFTEASVLIAKNLVCEDFSARAKPPTVMSYNSLIIMSSTFSPSSFL